MMPTRSQDTPPSLRLQLAEFYRLCPDGDYLTAEDVAGKYLVDLSAAYKVLKAMVADGQLESFQVPSQKMHRMIAAYRAAKVTA